MRKINIEDLKRDVLGLFKRFPMALAFLAMLTIWSLLNIWDKVYVTGTYRMHDHATGWFTINEIQQGTIFYYMSIAIVLSIVLQFWGEGAKNRKLKHSVYIGSHLLLLADAAFLWFRPLGSIGTELILGHLACCTALIIGGVFLPYSKEKDDLASWNLTLRMIVFACACFFFCGIMTGGMLLLLDSLSTLFNIGFNNSWYGTITILMMLTTSSMLWMSRIPKGKEKFNRKAITSKFMTGLIRYLFMPLVLCYLVVLYLYSGKILLSMELPRGGVCYYVHALMIGCLGIEVLLYPLLRKTDNEGREGNAFEHWLVKWLPLIILPLLMLMTIAIGRRIYDYGITVNRLYTLTLNLWYYAVCIGLFITHARRIHWVSLSFAALFLLTSALPINYCTITRHFITGRIEHYFEAYQHPELPLNENTYEEFMAQLPEQEAEQLQDDFRYIRSLYSNKDIAAFITDDVFLWKSFKKNTDERIRRDYLYNYKGSIQIPEGYHRFQQYSDIYTCSIKDSTLWHITINDSLCITISAEHLPKGEEKEKAWIIHDLNRTTIHCISHFSLSEKWNDSLKVDLSIEGYYFDK